MLSGEWKIFEATKGSVSGSLKLFEKRLSLVETGIMSEKYEAEMAKLVEEELIGLGLLNAEDIAKQDPDQPLV